MEEKLLQLTILSETLSGRQETLLEAHRDTQSALEGVIVRVEQLSHMADKSRAELTARIETSLGAQKDRLKGGLEMVHAAGQHLAE